MEFIPVVTNFGGLGVLAYFAWRLLKSNIKTLDTYADMTKNHLVHLDKSIQAFTDATRALNSSVNALATLIAAQSTTLADVCKGHDIVMDRLAKRK